MRSGRPAAELWTLTKATLSRHVAVVAAFRSAGQRMRSRRLTIRDIAESDLPQVVRASGGAVPADAAANQVSPRTSTKRKTRWHAVLNRIRQQILVVNAFRDGIVRRMNPSLQQQESRPVLHLDQLDEDAAVSLWRSGRCSFCSYYLPVLSMLPSALVCRFLPCDAFPPLVLWGLLWRWLRHMGFYAHRCLLSIKWPAAAPSGERCLLSRCRYQLFAYL
jgi:hypothetical protein